MKVFTGIVTSAKLPKTVTVKVERLLVHPQYKKQMRMTKKYLCHDEVGVKEEDVVSIKEIRPMSARKRFAVIGDAKIAQTSESIKTEEKVVKAPEKEKTTKKVQKKTVKKA